MRKTLIAAALVLVAVVAAAHQLIQQRPPVDVRPEDARPPLSVPRIGIVAGVGRVRRVEPVRLRAFGEKSGERSDFRWRSLSAYLPRV